MRFTNLTAAALPRLMAVDDRRGRITDLRAFVKDWAQEDSVGRAAMIVEAPRRARRHHRFTRRRDLPRIAAVVHALCDRDSVPVPNWVWEHRSPKPVAITDAVRMGTDYTRLVQAEAPSACAYHQVWFPPATIEDHRVHGFADHLVHAPA